MKSVEPNINLDYRANAPLPLSRLHLVTAFEVEDMRQALVRGELPTDFEAKLNRLATGDLTQRSVARNCRCFFALLLAAQGHLFTEATEDDCARLLRVLAYVRKDDDAIPDYQLGGFKDDHEEIRAVTTDLAELVQAFKAWRLRCQVPGMWAAAVSKTAQAA